MAKVIKIGVLSCAKISGIVYAAFGLVGGLFMAIFSLIGMALGGGEEIAAFGFFGIGGLIIFPIMYGIMGFIMGALMAFLYNYTAKWVGGLEVITQK